MLKTMVVNLLNKFRMICLNKNSKHKPTRSNTGANQAINSRTNQTERHGLKDQERENDTAVNTV